MKGKLEFDLEEPFERNAHMRAIKSTDAFLAIYDILQLFKDNDFIAVTNEEIYEILERRGIDMNILE